MTIQPTPFSPANLPASPVKNMLLALGMVLFLALSFKLTNDLTGDNSSISPTDITLSSLFNLDIPLTNAQSRFSEK